MLDLGGMEEPIFYFLSVVSFLFILVISKLLIFNKNRLHKNHPPSPPGLPIIGHLHIIKVPVHRALQNLSSKYGPVLSLRFGSRPAIIISSPSAAEECFTKNDIIMANRPQFLSGKHFHYNYTALGTAPYGPHWRNLRRVTTLEIFSTAKLNAYSPVRQDEIRFFIKTMYQDSKSQGFTELRMRSRLEELSFNIIMRIVVGKRYYDSKKAGNFRDKIRQISQLSEASHPADLFPFMKWFDLWGMEKKMVNIQKDGDGFLQGLIEEHRNNNNKDGIEEKNDTLIDTLLSMQVTEPEYYTDDIIKGLIMTMLLAGTDTSAVTMEWVMALLLNHPEVLQKAKAEIDKYVGQNRLVEETDVPNLQFLQNIVHETLRLYPSVPLLVPHLSSDDCKIQGFDTPKGTMVMFNAWAIHRDPEIWENPTSFIPERFEGRREGDQGYKFIPFGMGRRGCPGVGLANRIMGLTLASLIQCFDWERVSEELLDMSEEKGLTMPKADPLVAMFRPREEIIGFISEM